MSSSQLSGVRVIRYRDGLPVYWSGSAPAGLKTRRQLRAAGLSASGLRPVGWIHTPRHNEGPLYDPAGARPVRPITERQAAALEWGRRAIGTVECSRSGCKMRVSHEDATDECTIHRNWSS